MLTQIANVGRGAIITLSDTRALAFSIPHISARKAIDDRALILGETNLSARSLQGGSHGRPAPAGEVRYASVSSR